MKYNGSSVEEKDLFHGTRTEVTAKSICYQGVDPRVNTMTGSKLFFRNKYHFAIKRDKKMRK